ncbi:MAG: DUF4097 domain-containing protein [Terriglobia bacterium]
MRIVAAILLAAAVSLPLGAQTEATVQRGELQREGRAWVEVVECSVGVEPGGTLTVRADMGAVQVRIGADDRVSCQVRLAAYVRSRETTQRLLNNYQLSLRRVRGGSAYLGGEFRSGRRASRLQSVVLEIQVPLEFNLDVETGAGNVEVERLQGELRVATAAGEIRTGEILGPVRAETAGGNIDLGDLGGDLVARTAGGCVRVGNVQGTALLESGGGHIITGRIEGEVRAETAGGDIVLRGAGHDVIVQTAGGQIRVGEIGGSLQGQTAGGSIRLDAARGPVRVQTAGGSINLYQVQSGVEAATAAGSILAQISASEESFAPSALQTAVGDVEVYLPADLPLTIEATIDMASGYKISSDFPLEIEGSPARFRPTQLRGRGALNGGGALLRIQTVSGNIRIYRLDAASRERLRQQQQLYWQRWQQREDRRQRQQEREDR